jgi:uncharacterized SAM-binding protein YcdF (DUF218 family)
MCRKTVGMRSRRPRRNVNLWPLLLLVPTLWVGQSQVKTYLREPEAILVLGGSTEREHFAADFAQEHPQLDIWVSSGSNPEYAEWLFHEAAISRDRVHLDYQAVDTVTNFTTLVDELAADGIHSVYLITSDYHMRRAVIIGQIVLGSRDISFKPVIVPSQDPEPEPLLRGMRDGARALLWVFTGRTGSSLRESVSRR